MRGWGRRGGLQIPSALCCAWFVWLGKARRYPLPPAQAHFLHYLGFSSHHSPSTQLTLLSLPPLFLREPTGSRQAPTLVPTRSPAAYLQRSEEIWCIHLGMAVGNLHSKEHIPLQAIVGWPLSDLSGSRGGLVAALWLVLSRSSRVGPLLGKGREGEVGRGFGASPPPSPSTRPFPARALPRHISPTCFSTERARHSMSLSCGRGS